MKYRISAFRLLMVLTISLNCFISSSQVGIGTISPHNSALLDLSSSTQGLLLPRTDTTSITNPANGLIIYDTNEKALCYYNGSSWFPLISFNTITPGIGLATSNDSIFVDYDQGLNTSSGKLIARTDEALWNANKLQGNSITTIAPTTGQILTFDSVNWTPGSIGGLLTEGDGIDITGNTILVDVTNILGLGITEDASNNLRVVFGSTAGTSVQGNQLATITAGAGLTGGITGDSLGDGFNATLSVIYGTSANTAVQGNQTATILAGTGLSGGISSDSLGDGFATMINAQTTTALWNANQLQGIGINTAIPLVEQVFSFNGSSWSPVNLGSLLDAGDGINITGNTLDVDATDILGTGLSEDAFNNIIVNYGSIAGTAVEGNQTATITAGNGLTGGTTANSLGDGFIANLSVNYGISANTAVQGNQTAEIIAGNGLTGGISPDVLGNGFTATLNAETTTALWNANQLQGTGITTITPTSEQVLSYNGSNWNPTNLGELLDAGDGIDITTNTINVDVTDILGAGLSEDASNNIKVNYGTSANTAIQGNQVATITAGIGLAGGISNDTLGDGLAATLSAQTTVALWNANQLQGTGITTIAPTNGQVLSFNGTSWTPDNSGNLLNAGDGIAINSNTIDVDVTDILGTGISEDASNNLTVKYGISAGTAVQGNQTATITAGIGLSGGISADTLGDGFITTLNAETTLALWNANQLQGIPITTTSPINGYILAYNGSGWNPTTPGTVLNEGDGVNISPATSTIDVDVTDVISTGLSEDAFNNIIVIYGSVAGRAVEGNQTAEIIAGTGLTGGMTGDVLGNGFTTTINAETSSALWNAAQIQGVGVTTTAPSTGQILRHNGTNWAPASPNWTISGSDIYSSNTGNVGIGISAPLRKLHISDVMRLEPRTTAPASPAEGDIYYNSTDHKLKVYDGTIWQDCW